MSIGTLRTVRKLDFQPVIFVCNCYLHTYSIFTHTSIEMIMEIATFQLKVSEDLSNTGSEVSKVIRQTTTPNLKKHGARYVYYGQFIEKPDVVIIIVQWNSIDDRHHEMFRLVLEC